MKTQLIMNSSWQPATVATANFVVPAYGFRMRTVCAFASHRNVGMTTKHHAAAIKATAKGLQPWSPPVT